MNGPYRSASELGWIIQGWQADPTSGSLRGMFRREGFSKNRRGTLVVPGISGMTHQLVFIGPRQAGPSDTIVVGAIHEWPLPVDRFRGREKLGKPTKVVKAKAFTKKRR
ncbi:MAG: hypothetical protein KatS3mg112_0079 [Thermogutta sp.]|nr:MAG: hypothetical protein KatS3mg112_0079 [Thermogutta sp.]